MGLPALLNRTTPAPERASQNPPNWPALEELDRSLDRLFARWNPFAESMGLGSVPTLHESGDAYVVEVQMPEVERGDIDLEVHGRRLRICAVQRKKERTGRWRRKETVVGRVDCEVFLPGPVSPDEVTAGVDRGLLRVQLPKPESHRRRRIPVS